MYYIYTHDLKTERVVLGRRREVAGEKTREDDGNEYEQSRMECICEKNVMKKPTVYILIKKFNKSNMLNQSGKPVCF